MCSAKFFEDVPFVNSSWAHLGGIPVSEMNRLERTFLKLVNFSLYVPLREYLEVFDSFCHPNIHTNCLCKAHLYQRQKE